MSQSVDEGDDIARSIADYERLSGILWVGLGVIQILAVVTAIAGAWNVWAGISRFAMSKRVRAREAAVPQAYEGLTQLIVIGLVNLLVGGVIGLIFVGLDLFIRERVLTHRWVFTGEGQPAVLFKDQRLSVLEQLGRLRGSGVLSEEESAREKAKVLSA